jgi:hypothetical protein
MQRPASTPSSSEPQLSTNSTAQRSSQITDRSFTKKRSAWQIWNGGFRTQTDTRFEIASMTKPMTAIAIMQLVEDGKVGLDGHVSEYLPFYPRETGDRITVNQLLNHTSGLQQDIAFADDPNNRRATS